MKTETKKFPRVPVASWENAESGDTIGKEKSKHTPVPWKANKWASGWEVCAPDSHYTISRLGGCNNDESNAAFICRAVNSHADLLEACKAALGMFNEQMFIWGKDDDKKVCRMTKALSVAIQKAEGAL